MIRRITGLLLSFILFSCSIEYDGKTRFIVQGNVVDKDGSPLKDIKIEVDTQSGNQNDLISSTTTNEIGTSVQMFPPPKDEDATFRITVGSDDNVYLEKTISNISKDDFDNYVFELGTITLFKYEEVTTFEVLLENINQNTWIEDITIDGVVAETYFDYLETGQGYETSFRVLRNQSFNLYYTVSDFNTNPVTFTDYTVNLTIGSDPSTYTIVY